MSIPKPAKPEELYRFFITGLPREPAYTDLYVSILRRRGWNILADSDRNSWLLSISYYSNWKQDNPDWSLNTLKYK